MKKPKKIKQERFIEALMKTFESVDRHKMVRKKYLDEKALIKN